MIFKIFGNRCADMLFNFVIKVKKLSVKVKSKNSAHRGFSAGGHTDKDDVFLLSLDTAVTGEGDEAESLYELVPSGNNDYEQFETKETLRAAMKDFTDTERALIKLRFEDELSQSETAKRLGVSQMFVSRMERKLLARLKESLKDSV